MTSTLFSSSGWAAASSAISTNLIRWLLLGQLFLLQLSPIFANPYGLQLALNSFSSGNGFGRRWNHLISQCVLCLLEKVKVMRGAGAEIWGCVRIRAVGGWEGWWRSRETEMGGPHLTILSGRDSATCYIYGSFFPGRGKWAKSVLFLFFLKLHCDQTVWFF